MTQQEYDDIDQHIKACRNATPDPTVCEHGGLKRKCRTCELEGEVEWLTRKLTAIRVEQLRDAEAFDALRAKLVDAHRHCCTPENCVLDGGPEHAAAFLAKGETDVS